MPLALWLLLSILLLAASLLWLLHRAFRIPRLALAQTPASLGLAFETVWIDATAGTRLHGWWLSAGRSRQSIVLLHGWGSGSAHLLPLVGPFHRAGFNVLLFDARNHGRSDRHRVSSLPRFAEDLQAALAWLQCQHPQAAQWPVLLGHSVGAGAVLLEASRRQDIGAVISLSAFAHPAWVMRRFLARWHLPRALVALILAYVQWLIGYRFDAIAPLNSIRRQHCPVLLVHGRDDETVPLSDAEAVFRQADPALCEFLIIDGAGHGSTDKVEEHAPELLDWLQRCRPALVLNLGQV